MPEISLHESSSNQCRSVLSVYYIDPEPLHLDGNCARKVHDTINVRRIVLYTEEVPSEQIRKKEEVGERWAKFGFTGRCGHLRDLSMIFAADRRTKPNGNRLAVGFIVYVKGS